MNSANKLVIRGMNLNSSLRGGDDPEYEKLNDTERIIVICT